MKKANYKLHIIGDINKKKVLLIHGMGFYWKNCFDTLIKQLKDKYCLLIPELEGHAPDSKGEIKSVNLCAETIIKGLSIIRISKIECIYGISLGASIALEIALKNKFEINKLILDGGQYESMGENTEQFARIISEEFQKIINGNHMMTEVQTQMGYLKNNDINVLRHLMYLDVSLDTLYKAGFAAYSYDIKDREEKLDMNVILMCGGKEAYAQASIPLIQEKSLNTIKTCIFENKGHAEVLSKDSNEIVKLIES